MIVIYLRSSSINTYEQCAQKYFLSYVLGLQDQPHLKTVKGTILHKVMELWAQASIASKKGKKDFVDDQLGRLVISRSEDWPELCFDLYHQEHPALSKVAKANGINDLTDVKIWTGRTLTIKDGAFNPMELDVLSSEIKFDITFKQDWAHYKYDIHEGNLSIKGTIDLVVNNNGMVEIIDWKTGQCKNWVTNKPKTLEDFVQDRQTMMYALAIRELFPDQSYCMTYVWVNENKVFTVPFDDDYFKKAEQTIREVFEEIKTNQKPELLKNKFFCKTYCYFGKNSFENPSKWKDGSDKTMCAQVYGDVLKIGISKTMEKYMQSTDHLHKYGSGGGRK